MRLAVPGRRCRYTVCMHSVADDLRRELQQTVARLDPLERLRLALRLGDADVALYRSAHGVTEAEARATLSRARGIGRQSSVNDRLAP